MAMKSVACPFLPDSAPCSTESACATVDWSDPRASPGCTEEIIAYCTNQFNYENDVTGCGLFLDLFVSCTYLPAEEESAALQQGITQGREGKGIIYVWAAGNRYDTADDVNQQGPLVNSRYSIVVGAVGKDGLHGSYSTSGTGILVSAPGGDTDNWTNHAVAQAGGGCGDTGEGTSFAAPVVAAVCALILEVVRSKVVESKIFSNVF